MHHVLAHIVQINKLEVILNYCIELSFPEIDVHFLIVGHVTGCRTEFSVSLNHFVDSFQKVFFSCHFPSCSDGKHSSFCAYTSNFRTCEKANIPELVLYQIKHLSFDNSGATDRFSKGTMHTVSKVTEINKQCIYDYRSIIIYVALKL